MTALLCFSAFCMGLWYERARVDRLAKARTDRIAEQIIADARVPRIAWALRPLSSYVLDGGTTYRVPDVDALIAMDCSRAPTDRGSR